MSSAREIALDAVSSEPNTAPAAYKPYTISGSRLASMSGSVELRRRRALFELVAE